MINSEDYDKDDPRYHDALTEHLPNFMSEWSDYISMEPDASLSGENYGVEIMMQTYLDGIEEAFGFLDDLYNHFAHLAFLISRENGIITFISSLIMRLIISY